MTDANELMDAKIGACEARLGREFASIHAQVMARLETLDVSLSARMDGIDARMAHIDSRMEHIEQQNRSTRANIWSAAAFVVGSMIAVIALLATVAPYAFDKGADLHDRVAAEVAVQIANHQPR